MAEDQNERRAREFLEGKGLRCERFSKEEQRRGKTPDFRVYHSSLFRFYSEVKGIVRDTWWDRLRNARSTRRGTVVGGSRPYPVPNRITDDIHQAVKQFDAVNPDQQHPNVLVFVNNPGSHCDWNDYIEVFTGNIVTEDGLVEPAFAKYAHGRIREEKYRVHLSVWLEESDRPRYHFPTLHGEHVDALLTLFNLDRSEIEMLDA